MSDIFLSYASEDRQTAKALAGALEQCGWSVWWDRRIPIGMDYAEVIESELTAARCVMVLWSAASVDSEWVKNEAADASKRRILVPVLIENVQIPFEFRRKQAADLTGWRGEPTHAGFSVLVGDLSKRLGRPPTTAHEQPPAVTRGPRRRRASPPETSPPPPAQEEAAAENDDERAHAAAERATESRHQRDGGVAAVGPSKHAPRIFAGVLAAIVLGALVWVLRPGGPTDPNYRAQRRQALATPTQAVASNAGGGTQNSNLGKVVGNLHPDAIRNMRRQTLVQQLNDANEGKRRNATNALKSEFAADATAVSLALDHLEETKIGELSPQGLINVIYFLNETADAAWSSVTIQRAETAVAVLERRRLADRARKELARFKTRVKKLSAFVLA